MIALGLVLLVLCVLLAAGIASSNPDPVSAEAFGLSLSDVWIGGLFLLGCAIGAVAMLGLALMVTGATRGRARRSARRGAAAHRQESLAEENDRLRAQLERRHGASPAYPDEPGARSDAVVESRGTKHLL